MTHREHDTGWEFEAQAEAFASRPFQEVLELLIDHGLGGIAQAMRMLLNEAMKLERSELLAAQPYQRTPTRRG
jgi:uncharacterized protein with von Willebrand factor type A (vWA) domain